MDEWCGEIEEPDTVEEIAADLAAMLAFEPVVLTTDEQEAWEEGPQARRAREKARIIEYPE